MTDTEATYDGNPHPVTVTTDPTGLAHTVTYDGNPTPPTNPGTYAVEVTITEPGYTSNPNPYTAELVINQAPSDPVRVDRVVGW